MKAAVLLVLTVTVAGQNRGPTALQLLNTDGPLRADEIATVLAGVRAAIAGRTVRLAAAPDGPGPDILVRADGRPRIVRTVGGITGGMIGADRTQTTWHKTIEIIADYTGTPARGCDGTPLDGDLIVEYRNEDNRGWVAAARTATSQEVAAPIFEALSGRLGMEGGETRTFGRRRARAFVAPWTSSGTSITWEAAAGDPRPGVAGDATGATRHGTQTLWVDTESLRPIRWSVSLPGIPSYALMFTYDLSPEPRIPDGIAAPECVP
jgi:hypothetical protein